MHHRQLFQDFQRYQTGERQAKNSRPTQWLCSGYNVEGRTESCSCLIEVPSTHRKAYIPPWRVSRASAPDSAAGSLSCRPGPFPPPRPPRPPPPPSPPPQPRAPWPPGTPSWGCCATAACSSPGREQCRRHGAGRGAGAGARLMGANFDYPLDRILPKRRRKRDFTQHGGQKTLGGCR